MAKGIRLQDFYVTLQCYLGAGPIPYVQNTILNLPNLYLRSPTVLLDSVVEKMFNIQFSIDSM